MENMNMNMPYTNQPPYEYSYYGEQYYGPPPATARVSPPLAYAADHQEGGRPRTFSYLSPGGASVAGQEGRQRTYSYPPAPPVPRFGTAFSPVEPKKFNGKRRVTFKPTCTVRTHTGNPEMTKEEKFKVLYYTRDELKIMNLEAHAICTLSQELPDICNSGTLLTIESERRASVKLGTLEDGEEDTKVDTHNLDTLRGLELIMYPKRKQNKLLAKRSLLKYQTMLKSKPNVSAERMSLLLAAASAKLNLWSSLVAMETARLDALRAYECDYMVPIAPKVDIMSPFPFYRKRAERPMLKRRGSRRITFEGESGDSQTMDQQWQCKKRRRVESRDDQDDGRLA